MKTAEDIREMLREAIKKAGNQKRWAELAGVSPQYVSDVLKGRREPGESIAKMFGYKSITLYIKV